MPDRFLFDASILNSVAGGHSAIDIARLNIQTPAEADAFIGSYGFNSQDSEDIEKLWYYHRRALVLMYEKLLFKEDEVPERLRERKNLEDIRNLLILASSRRSEDTEIQKWACAILRCMHVFVHSENDLFSSFSEEIQSQILTPFQQAIWHDGSTHRTFLKSQSDALEAVELLGFEVKPFKTSASTVIKLLAKPDALAMKLFDKLGVRFVTKNLFDTFQVVRFLVRENIISFPHIMPDQSSNNLYPVDLFLEVCRELSFSNEAVDEQRMENLFNLRLAESGGEKKLFRKENSFSGTDYRFIKFISRKLIYVKAPLGENGAPLGQAFSFFYPFEVQIMDHGAHTEIQSGPSEHQAYKERQRMAARRRVLPSSEDPVV